MAILVSKLYEAKVEVTVIDHFHLFYREQNLIKLIFQKPGCMQKNFR